MDFRDCFVFMEFTIFFQKKSVITFKNWQISYKFFLFCAPEVFGGKVTMLLKSRHMLTVHVFFQFQ
jgi:hypothetical protein